MNKEDLKGRIKVSLLGTIHCMNAEFYAAGLIEGDNTGQPGKYLQAHVTTRGMEDKVGVWVFFRNYLKKNIYIPSPRLHLFCFSSYHTKSLGSPECMCAKEKAK